MAKKVYKIEAFEGGLNQLADPRDIEDNQFEELLNADVSKKGRIRLPGNALQVYQVTNFKDSDVSPGSNPNTMSNDSNGLTPGYGLFAFSHDYNMQGLGLGEEIEKDKPDEFETEFICINDGAHIDIWDSCHTSIGEDFWIERAIRLGNVHIDDGNRKVKPSYYKADNGLRVCDSNFSVLTVNDAMNESNMTATDTTLSVDSAFEFWGGDVISGGNEKLLGTYIKVDNEIMKISGIDMGASTLTVVRGQFGTEAVSHLGNAGSSLAGNFNVKKINVPKILSHINRPLLEKSGTGVIINRWVEDIQFPEPPNKTTIGGFHGLSIFQNGKILSSASSTLLSGTIYPVAPEKVIMGFIEAVDDDEEFWIEHTNADGTTAGTVSGSSSEQIIRLPIVDEGFNTVPDDFPGNFAIGKAVTIEGCTVDAIVLNGIHEIVGLGEDFITIAHEAPATYTATHFDGASLRLEQEVLSDDLKNKYILGMSFLYEGGGNASQESDIEIGALYNSEIPQRESVFKTVGNWRTSGADDNFNAELLPASAGDGMQLLNGRVVINNPGAVVKLGYITSDITAGADYYVSVNVTSYTDGTATVAVGQITSTDDGEFFEIEDAGTFTQKITAGSTASLGVSIQFTTDATMTINNVQVWKASVTEMSSTNALDLRTLISAAKTSLSFLCNNSRERHDSATEGHNPPQNNSWNERIEGFRIYMKQVDMIGEGLTEEWLLLYDVNIKDGTYICHAKDGDIETLRLGDISGHVWEESPTATLSNDQFYQRAVVTTNLSGDSIKNVPLFTYESENGYPAGTNLAVMYKTATTVQRKVYIGNLKIGERTYPDRMMRADADKFDSFPSDGTHYIDVATADGDSIIKLESLGDKLLQFKKKTTYVITVSSEGEELVKTWPNAGVLAPCQVVKAKDGIVWVNDNGLFYYDGEKLKRVTDDRFASSTWVLNEDENIPVMLGYDETSDKVIIQTLNTEATDSGGFIYDLKTGAIMQVQKLFNWYMANEAAGFDGNKIGPPVVIKGGGEGPIET